jgi:glutathione S-transferase
MPDLNWRDAHPNLDKYYARISQRQSFVDTAPV